MRKYDPYKPYKLPSPAKEITKNILLTLALAGGFCIACTNPYFIPKVLKAYFRDLSRKREREYARSMYQLRNNKDIIITRTKNSITIKLTRKGDKRVLKYNLEDMRIQIPPQWDGMWHIVLYDIPKSYKKASDAFREKIKQLDLFRIQKSVWVYPYPLEDEITFLRSVFRIPEEKVLHFSSVIIPKQKEVWQYFKDRGILK